MIQYVDIIYTSCIAIKILIVQLEEIAYCLQFFIIHYSLLNKWNITKLFIKDI